MDDESWRFMYNPETKCQSATWLSPKKPKAQNVRMQKSQMKTMLTAFFDAKGIIHHKFVPGKQPVKGKFHKEMNTIEFVLGLSFRKVGPGTFCTSMQWHILRAFSPNFWRNEGSLCYPTHPTTLT
jgi:hypothetical protein